MGGRGSSSYGGTSSTGVGFGGNGQSLGLAGQTYFDGRRVSVSGTLNFWENKSVNLKHEELLMVGEDGFAAGYFKGGESSVSFAIPKGVDPAKTVLTHNHPYGGKDGRTIGGGFSDADVTNHIKHGFKETRATSIEGTYSFKTGKNANPQGFQNALSKRKSEVEISAQERYLKAKDGKSYLDTYLEESHKWYEKNAGKYGYDYKLIRK